MELMRKCKRCGEIKPLTSEYYLKEKECKGGFRPICKECKYGKSGVVPRKAKEGHKICPRCGEEKPLSPEFWARDKSIKTGFHPICKACKNKTSKIVVTWNREGFRICSKCGIEKPLTEEYYAPNKKKSYGFDSACRSCMSITGRKSRGTYREGFTFCRICSKEYEIISENFPESKYFDSGFGDVCNNCCRVLVKTKYEQIKIGHKFCIQCGRQLPETTEFFFKTGGKFFNRCKECEGYTFGVKQRVFNRKKVDGHKYCTQCGQLFPLSTKYFYRSPAVEDGFGVSCKNALMKKQSLILILSVRLKGLASNAGKAEKSISHVIIQVMTGKPAKLHSKINVAIVANHRIIYSRNISCLFLRVVGM